MSTPQLYRQLQAQLSQWICPQDQRHLQVFCENVAAILQAQSACLSHWLPYLSHRDCQARSHMERLNYFVHNPKITAETFYFPLLQQFLSAWAGMAMTLTLDTSVLWDQYCLIEGNYSGSRFRTSSSQTATCSVSHFSLITQEIPDSQ